MPTEFYGNLEFCQDGSNCKINELENFTNIFRSMM